jgi:DNA-binding CsgD family transcriptional regulator
MLDTPAPGVSAQARDVTARLKPILDPVGQRCGADALKFGFPFYHLAIRLVVSPGIPLQIFLDGGPKELRRASDSGFGPLTDRILAKAAVTTIPFEWNDPAEPYSPFSGGVENRQEGGMRHGVAVPLHGPFGAHGVWSLGGSAPVHASRHMLNDLLRHIQWAAMEVFGQLVLDVSDELQRKPRERLTDRQHRALALAAKGQSLAEIGKQMGIHISTARYLIATAGEKLGVATREEAIVRFTLMNKAAGGFYPQTLRQSQVYVAVQCAPQRKHNQPQKLAFS